MKNILIGIVLVAVTGAGAVGWNLMKTPRYRFNPYQKHPSRPHPTELLVEVKQVRDIDEKSSGPKSASIIIHEYKKELEAVAIEGGKPLKIQFTQQDFDKAGKFDAGDRLAVFGWEPSDGTVFRIEKYPGTDKSPESVNRWFRSLP